MHPTRTAGGLGGFQYERHQPEQTLLYQVIAQHYPVFKESLEAQGRSLPEYVQREFDEFLTCGRLEHGFLRVRCEDCKHDRLVAFSCKRRGFCPSCGARRMAESAALLVEEVLIAVASAELLGQREPFSELAGIADYPMIHHAVPQDVSSTALLRHRDSLPPVNIIVKRPFRPVKNRPGTPSPNRGRRGVHSGRPAGVVM